MAITQATIGITLFPVLKYQSEAIDGVVETKEVKSIGFGNVAQKSNGGDEDKFATNGKSDQNALSVVESVGGNNDVLGGFGVVDDTKVPTVFS